MQQPVFMKHYITRLLMWQGILAVYTVFDHRISLPRSPAVECSVNARKKCLVSTMTSGEWGERWPHIRETSPRNAFLPIFFDLALWKNSSSPVQLPAQHTTTCRGSSLGLISSMCWFDLLIIGDLLLQSHRWVEWWEIRLLKHGYLPLVGFLMLVFANGTDRITMSQTVQELRQKILPQICYKTTDYYLFVCKYYCYFEYIYWYIFIIIRRNIICIDKILIALRMWESCFYFIPYCI